jgi:long-subunit acyl-CoA synthetase (AMP-forming)
VTAVNDVEAVAADITRAVAGKTLLDAFADNARRHGAAPALSWRSGGRWTSLTWREYRERVERATLGLRELGLRPGDRVGILMSNRPELAIADVAVLHARAVPVCLFDSFTDSQLATVLRSLAVGFVIVEGRAELDRLTRASNGAPLRSVVAEGRGDDLDDLDDLDDRSVSWERVMAAGRECAARRDGGFDACWRAVRPDDVVSVNYTSGTTGSLKGVRHTHRNVLWHAESFGRFMPVPAGTRFLAYLPRAHATERFVTTWFPLVRAGTVHLCPDPGRLPEFLREVRPQFFGGVLRVWEKLYAAVNASVADGDPVARQGIAAGLGLDECGFAFSGGGALAPPVQEFFNAIGVPLTEGWGQSELVSAATCARPDQIRAGTVGLALPGVAVRTADDGELLVRSGSRMLGYVEPPGGTGLVEDGLVEDGTVEDGTVEDGTVEDGTVDADGWVHTGDLGEIGADGYVRVRGRRQEVIRLADGYILSTTRVESHLRANLLVDHACVVGEAQAGGLCAILVVTTPSERWSLADLVRTVRDGNRHLPDREQITRFAVLTDPWEPGRTDELTHTGKIKRSVVTAKYAELIGALRRSETGVGVADIPAAR